MLPIPVAGFGGNLKGEMRRESYMEGSKRKEQGGRMGTSKSFVVSTVTGFITSNSNCLVCGPTLQTLGI